MLVEPDPPCAYTRTCIVQAALRNNDATYGRK